MVQLTTTFIFTSLFCGTRTTATFNFPQLGNDEAALQLIRTDDDDKPEEPFVLMDYELDTYRLLRLSRLATRQIRLTCWASWMIYLLSSAQVMSYFQFRDLILHDKLNARLRNYGLPEFLFTEMCVIYQLVKDKYPTLDFLVGLQQKWTSRRPYVLF